jgi:hypothetical protein
VPFFQLSLACNYDSTALQLSEFDSVGLDFKYLLKLSFVAWGTLKHSVSWFADQYHGSTTSLKAPESTIFARSGSAIVPIERSLHS